MTEHEMTEHEMTEMDKVGIMTEALTDIMNVGKRHSDEMVAVGFCVARAKMALDSLGAGNEKVDDVEVARIAKIVEWAVGEGKKNMLWRGKVLDFRRAYPDPTSPIREELVKAELERLLT